MSNYEEIYNQSISAEGREKYWADIAKDLSWFTNPTTILDKTQPPFYRWFVDGKMNICHNCIDRHLEQFGNKTALIWESPALKQQAQFTYKQLYENVARLAWVLKQFGIRKNDRVLIYLPNIPEAVFAMLACARIGAVHVVVYGGFPAKELATRITECQPKMIITASAGLEKGDKIVYYKGIVDAALELSSYHNLTSLIVQREIHMTSTFVLKRDYDYYTAIKVALLQEQCEITKGNDPLYILFASGDICTKGIVHDHAGTAIYSHWQTKQILGIGNEDVLFSATDVGWIVGHIFMVYGAFLEGATTILYEGKAVGSPDNFQFWRLIEKYKVNCLFTTPTSIREIRKEDPLGANIQRFKLTTLKNITTTGEHIDLETQEYLKKHINKNLFINNLYIQQEIGGAISGNLQGMFNPFPDKPGSVTKPYPGFEVHILDNQNVLVTEPNVLGKVSLKTPLPPSFMLTLFNNDEVFMKKYLGDSVGYYTTGDAGFFDEEGYLWVVGRIDDIIKTGGKKLSMASVEQVLQSVSEIVNSAVVSKYDDLWGEIPFGFVVVENGKSIKNRQQFENQVVGLVEAEIGSYANFKHIIIVQRLPQTRNGEILRSLLKKMLNDEPFKIPANIEDESVIAEIKEAIETSERPLKSISPLNTKLKKFSQEIDKIESPSYKRRYGKEPSSPIKSFKLHLQK